MTDGFIDNEWIRMDKLKEIFGIEPFRCFATHDYLINDHEMLSVNVVYPFHTEGPTYFVEYSQIEIDDRHGDTWVFKKDSGHKYFYPETFGKLVECFHKWFRYPDDEEQLELF